MRGARLPMYRLRVALAVVMAALFVVGTLATCLWLAALGLDRLLVGVNAQPMNLLQVMAGIGLWVLAGMLALATLPPLRRVDPPGVELHEVDQPALFAQVRRVAKATGQLMPARVYLVADANAFVTQAGGLWGLFDRPVLGVGLPLLSLLTVSELRAVLTHELGHAAAGDTRLGPWLVRARLALLRTVDTLASVESLVNRNAKDGLSWLGALLVVLGAPLRLYAWLYVRLTQGLSQAQEYAADALAVRLEGAEAFVRGLTRTHGGAVAYHVFLRNEVAPLVQLGYRPPLAEGFADFITVDDIAQLIDRPAEAQLGQPALDQTDSHPPLSERVARARRAAPAQAAPSSEEDTRPALALLRGVPTLEAQLARDWGEGPLASLPWPETGAALARAWLQRRAATAKVLQALTPATLPRDELTLRTLAGLDPSGPGPTASLDDLHSWARDVYAEALFAQLVDAGFTAHNRPGHPVRFVRGPVAFEPGPHIAAYLAGALSDEQWCEPWRQAEVLAQPFSPVTGEAPRRG